MHKFYFITNHITIHIALKSRIKFTKRMYVPCTYLYIYIPYIYRILQLWGCTYTQFTYKYTRTLPRSLVCTDKIHIQCKFSKHYQQLNNMISLSTDRTKLRRDTTREQLLFTQRNTYNSEKGKKHKKTTHHILHNK